MDDLKDDLPLSQSNVSLRLADIQERCSQLLADDDNALGLALEEPLPNADENNPYSRG